MNTPQFAPSALDGHPQLRSKRLWTAPTISRLDLAATEGGYHPPPYHLETAGVLGCVKTNTTSALTHSCSAS